MAIESNRMLGGIGALLMVVSTLSTLFVLSRTSQLLLIQYSYNISVLVGFGFGGISWNHPFHGCNERICWRLEKFWNLLQRALRATFQHSSGFCCWRLNSCRRVNELEQLNSQLQSCSHINRLISSYYGPHGTCYSRLFYSWLGSSPFYNASAQPARRQVQRALVQDRGLGTSRWQRLIDYSRVHCYFAVFCSFPISHCCSNRAHFRHNAKLLGMDNYS